MQSGSVVLEYYTAESGITKEEKNAFLKDIIYTLFLWEETS